jgi:hypothetical protein
MKNSSKKIHIRCQTSNDASSAEVLFGDSRYFFWSNVRFKNNKNVEIRRRVANELNFAGFIGVWSIRTNL